MLILVASLPPLSAATEGARQQLALRACALLGAPLPPHFCSSNAPGAEQAHFYATSLASGSQAGPLSWIQCCSRLKTTLTWAGPLVAC